MYSLAGSSVLVTGGCGFIGSHLVGTLIQKGAENIIILDSLKYGSTSNLQNDSGAINVVQADIGSDQFHLSSRDLEGVDYVFHLAAEKHNNQSSEDATQLLKANIVGTYKLLRAAQAAQVKKMIFTSSLYVYDRLAPPAFSESESTMPRTVYGISKLAGENLLLHAARSSSIACNIARLFFIYGPRQYCGAGYPSVIVKNFQHLLRGEPAIVNGDGTQVMDYLFVDDAVRALIFALESDISGDVFNVGSGEPLQIGNLIDEMIAVSGGAANRIHRNPDWTAGTFRVANIEKIRAQLGWQPSTSLHEGLRKTLEWLKES